MALTLERLKELYRYDPETGSFHRLVKRSGGRIGKVSTRPNGDGYLRLCVDYVSYQQHRLAWFYMTGEWPELVDHINHDRADNRWANLRNADQTVNQLNRARARPDSTTGVLGAFKTPDGKFCSSVRVDGKQHFVGRFDTAEEAGAAYQAKKAALQEAR